jgi:hypothetical protein
LVESTQGVVKGQNQDGGEGRGRMMCEGWGMRRVWIEATLVWGWRVGVSPSEVDPCWRVCQRRGRGWGWGKGWV